MAGSLKKGNHVENEFKFSEEEHELLLKVLYFKSLLLSQIGTIHLYKALSKAKAYGQLDPSNTPSREDFAKTIAILERLGRVIEIRRATPSFATLRQSDKSHVEIKP